MQRVIEGYTRAAAAAAATSVSQEEDGVLVGTLELPSEVRLGAHIRSECNN